MSSSNKRYYWLKLKEDFFEDDTIQWLEEQENGKDYVIFYLKLALKSLNDDGKLIRYVGETLIPYDVKALSKLTNTPTDTVVVALDLFSTIGLISRLDSGEIYMNQIDEMVGSETAAAEKMRRLRAKENDQKQLDSNAGNNVTESYPELLEIEKELEVDKETERNSPNLAKAKIDDTHLTLAKLLWKYVKDNFPKTKEPNLENWADDIRLAMEQDDRSYEDLKSMIIFSQTDDFWYANVRSGKKLRDQFDTLYAQADRKGFTTVNKKINATSNVSSAFEDAFG